MAKSIIQPDKEVCFICGASTKIRHHIYHGTGLRQVSEDEGEWVYLCDPHHTYLHNLPSHPYDAELKKIGQEKWIVKKMQEGYSRGQARGLWLNKFGRFYD